MGSFEKGYNQVGDFWFAEPWHYKTAQRSESSLPPPSFGKDQAHEENSILSMKETFVEKGRLVAVPHELVDSLNYENDIRLKRDIETRVIKEHDVRSLYG